MSTISGIGASMNLAAGALSVHSTAMQVASHNIANVNTGDFAPQRATFADGSSGIGVNLEAVRKQETPEIANAPEQMQTLWGGSKPSGTEVAREVPQLLSTQRAFEANAATIRAADEMLGSLLNTIA